ncbi:MAG: hypothetical protein ACTSW1_08300 [Candidatus Hodarchaeales archaeon]
MGYIAHAKGLSPDQRKKVYGVSDHWAIYELVPPEVFDKYGAYSLRFIDQKAIPLLEFIRVKTGMSVTVNNWFWCGAFRDSGFRTPYCEIGANLSSHKRGTGLDPKIKGWTTSDWQKFIDENKVTLIKLGVTGYEDLNKTFMEEAEGFVSWCHMTFEYFFDSVGKIKIIRI